MCDNCKQAAYELDLQWGAGKLDYGKLREMLNREEEETNV